MAKLSLKDIYEMTISDSINLGKEVEKNGKLIKKEWTRFTATCQTRIYLYKGNEFYLDGFSKIVDVNDTAKDFGF